MFLIIYALFFSLGGVVRSGTGGGLAGGRYRRDVREMDAEEEMWFNNEDDDLEDTHSPLNIMSPSSRECNSPPLSSVVDKENTLVAKSIISGISGNNNKHQSTTALLLNNGNKDNNNTTAIATNNDDLSTNNNTASPVASSKQEHLKKKS